jgi:hypothetical protein
LCGPCSPNSKHARSPHGDAAAEVLKVHDSTETDNGLPDGTGRLVLDTNDDHARMGSGRVGSDVAQTAVQGQEETSLAGSSCKHYPILTLSKPFIGHGVHVVPQGAQRLSG